MQHFTAVVFAFLVLFSSKIVSGAVPERRDDKLIGRRDNCLSKHQAEEIQDLWIGFNEEITDGGAALRQIITDDVKFFSESFNLIVGILPV